MDFSLRAWGNMVYMSEMEGRKVLLVVIAAVGLGALVVAALFFFPFFSQTVEDLQRTSKEMNHITLTTEDNVRISADYYPASGSQGALLLHMMPATKESWRGFAAKLQRLGVKVLAIDLRGHGQSEGGPDGFRSFSDVQHQESIADVAAGARYLAEQGVAEKNLSVIGASIGANLALWYGAMHPAVSRIVLLSPGLNYRGIETLPLAGKLQASQRVFIAASRDDDGNADMARQIFEALPENTANRLVIYRAAGHGTSMFGKEKPDLEEEILDWLY